MDLLKQYFGLQEQIFAFFGYVEDWRIIPLSDHTGYYWILEQKDDGSGHVLFHEKPFDDALFESGMYYRFEIYTQRHLPQWVYSGEGYTMVCCDTQQDMNYLLCVFDNEKRMTMPDEWRE